MRPEMTLLSSPAIFTRWRRKIEAGQSIKLTPPTSYPCYGLTVVVDMGCEESEARYLYPRDVRRMLDTLASKTLI